MKKILVIMVPVAILGLLFAGCANFSNITTPGTTQEGFSYIAKGGPTEDEADSFPLYAGQDMLVGEVLVWDDGETLCIKYQLSDYAIDDGWLIYETHLAVADDLSGIPTNRPGNPIPGLFPYGDDNLEGVESYEECISFKELEIVCDDVIVIAAHAVVKRQVLVEDCWETVWQIGDVEESQMDNPCDEFNYPSIVNGPQHFYVGTTLTEEFPWISRYDRNFAPIINIYFSDELPFGGKFFISWSPGASGKEIWTASLDGTALGKIERISTPVDDWWEKYEFFVETFDIGPTDALEHILDITFTSGDGAVWDWIRLERPCVKEESETAWGAVEQGKKRFVQRGNWATYFEYTVECPECVEDFLYPDTLTLWQIGKPDGAVNPINGAAEYPAEGKYYPEFNYTIGTDFDPIDDPSIPGYIGSVNVCDIDPHRPCTDTTMRLNIQFELNCAHEEGDLILFYDRYGSETDTLYFDFDGIPFATVSATEGGFKKFELPLPACEAGTHTISIAYEGGGDANGHYIDYLKLVQK